MSSRRTRILRHLRALVGERHPDGAQDALRRTERYLAREFSRQGWKTSKQAFGAGGKTHRNVLSIREPTGSQHDAGAAPLLIGAHYDTVVGSPGADDNASALAVLLEAAHRLKDADPARSIWLAAFSLEEQGLLGSRAFVSRLKKSGRPLAGAVILECVGYTSRTPDSQRHPPGVPTSAPTVGNFLAIVGNESSRALIASVEQSARRALLPTFALVAPSRGEALPDVRRSDHASFWDEDFPAVMLTDTANFRNPHYHQPTDRIETLDLGFIEQVSDVVLDVIRTFATGESR